MKLIKGNTKLEEGIIKFHGFYKIPSKTNKLLLTFFILIFFSCNRYKEETTVIRGMMQGSGINCQTVKKCVVLIVPATGCSTCINPVKEFIRQIDNPKFIIIGSCYSSRDCKMSFSEHVLENKNCIIDSVGQAFRHGLVENGARLYFFKACKITDVRIVSCTEPNLLNLTINFLGKE